MHHTSEARVIETMFKILNKDGHLVDFRLNDSQYAYDLVRSNRDLIPKARQKGFSAFGVALQVVKCLGIPGTRAVLISHEAGATQRLLDRAQLYLKYLKGPKAELGRNSRNELYFPKTESTYYIGTAGARAFGRGDTITDLHISEYAWWEGAGIKHVAGLMQAVPMSGCVRIESTGNGMNNDFYYMVKNADKLGYQTFFRSWHDDPEYSRVLPERGYVPEGYEEYFEMMQGKYNLTEEQLYWYYVKLLEFRGDLRMMQQEYPSSVEECFQATGGAMFPYTKRRETKDWTWHVEDGKRVERLASHPDPNYTYVLGADPSGGTGNDEAAIVVLCLETLEEVFEYGSSSIDPVDFGHYICDIGKQFNDAFLIVESNNHGIAAHSIIKKNYNLQKVYKKAIPKYGTIKYGFITNENSKHELVGAITELFELELTIYGKLLLDELHEFSEDAETKKMQGPSDNRVIALGLACVGYMRYERYKKDRPTLVTKSNVLPYRDRMCTFESIFKNLNDKRKQERRTGILPETSYYGR